MLPPKMYHQEFDSPEELQDAINCFWYTAIDFNEQASSFEVTPDGYTEIIFYFGSNLKISRNGVFHSMPSPFMMGLLNQPVHFHTKNKVEVIGIRCYPWTVFDLLGLPSGEKGVQTFEHPIAELQSNLNKCIETGKIEDAIHQIKHYFLDAKSHIPANSMLFKAGVAMRGANGTMLVSEVAEAAHATVRTLERKFKQSSGHTVKDVSALMRFEQVRNQLWSDPDTNIASLAHEVGYSDQSHLIREFKRYSGVTPAAFARKTKKGRQIMGDDFVVFVQS
ncbi:AraC family transcriptional regulator [Flavobacterium sp. 270]|nr:AraC family transcriptional regulator [Flavobacterium sp. 270]